MVKIPWTASQKLAIETIDGDILLTAAAGAGKTAVLAQRCLHLLTKIDPPCGMGELLVLTFTNTAAAEMRQRIGQALQEALGQPGADGHLRRQLALLDQADICTLHAFCSSLLREYFHRLGIDPAFEMMDGDQTTLLKHQIAGEVLEDYYSAAEGNPGDFLAFVDAYGASGTDRSVMGLLLELQRFLETLENPALWQDHWQAETAKLTQETAEPLQLVQRQQQQLHRQLEALQERLTHAQESLKYFPDLAFYQPHLLQLRDMLTQWGRLQQEITLPKAPNRPQGMTDDDIRPIKDLIDQAKGHFKALQAVYGRKPEELRNELRTAMPFVGVLLGLHRQLITRYERAKRQQNVMDFADLEHQALALLRDENGPTDIATELQRRYRHILVDEYQDIAPVQEAILACLRRKDHGGNVFMVGDVKQSIYSFRQADPHIFLHKLRTFKPLPALPAGDGSWRIDLQENFRSRREVIEAVNTLFSRCMTEPFCAIDYLHEGQLIFGAQGYDAANAANYRVEWHLLERYAENEADAAEDEYSPTPATQEAFAEWDATRREAAIVAARIRRMVGAEGGAAEFTILDTATKQNRPVTYRDIVILMRSLRVRAEVWSEVFTRMGVPLHAQQTGGYLQATEIQDMLSLLQLLSNPRQDIPLAAVLRGPLVSLNESHLAMIRRHSPEQPFHQAVWDYTESGPDAELRRRLETFGGQLDTWRTAVRQGPLADVIWRIYTETDLPAFVSGLPQGPQRYQNLIQLHDRARQFDTFARQGLGRFLEFIEDLLEQEGDLGTMPVLTEADNVVRLMSVHKSKGLEFPVVIVADLARKFNFRDSRQTVLFDRPEEFPIGLQTIDAVSRDHWETVAHRIIADTRSQRNLAEEMRILYVALTRAREKLLLVGSTDLEAFRTTCRLWQHHQGALPAFLLRGANTPLDWLGPTLAGHEDIRSFLQGQNQPGRLFDIHGYDPDAIAALMGNLTPESRTAPPAQLEDLVGAIPHNPPDLTGLMARIQWRYPQAELTRLPARTRVTELKRQVIPLDDEEFTPAAAWSKTPAEFSRTPRFLQEHPSAPGAMEKGIWVHQFLQAVDLAAPLDEADLRRQWEGMVRQGLFAEGGPAQIDFSAIAGWFASPLGRELIAHRDRLQREWAFTLAVPVGELYPDLMAGASAQEKILVRGVIDAFYETPAGMVIVDFKTDQITAEQAAARAAFYQPQLKLYRRAVETILLRPVVKTVLYFLTPQVARDVTAKSSP